MRFVAGRAGLAVLLPLVLARGAGADVFTVTTASADPVPVEMTLTEALAAAAQNPGADTIEFALPPGDHVLTIGAGAGGTAFGPAAIEIDQNLAIVGPTDGARVALHPDPIRLANVLPTGALRLENLTITGGLARGGAGGNVQETADEVGATVGQPGGGGAGLGGAIYNQGVLEIQGCTFVENRAEGGAGGLLFASPFPDIAWSTGGGGGLGGSGGGASFAPVPYGSGGGGGTGGDGSLGGFGGGSIEAATLESPGRWNGGRPGQDGGRGGGGGGLGFEAHEGETLPAEPNGISSGDGGFGGGGGGGLEAGDGGFGGGGGGGLLFGGDGGFGGGGGAASIERALTGWYPGAGGFGAGAGLEHEGGSGAGMGGAVFNHEGTVRVVNSTFSWNVAAGGVDSFPDPLHRPLGLGGAIFNLGGSVELSATTFARNEADGGSDVYNLVLAGVVESSDLLVERSILGSEFSTNVVNRVIGRPASQGSAVLAGANLAALGVANLGGALETGALAVADPHLAPLDDTLGPTGVHLPDLGSPAIDAAQLGKPVDQRGVARPQGSAFDLGAVEVEQDEAPPPGCGDAIVEPGEECDGGDGCSASCTFVCTEAPLDVCIAASAGSLSVDERNPGNERLALQLGRFASATTPADFGDPVGGDPVQLACVYDAAGALAVGLRGDDAGATCGAKPCWKALGTKGFAYRDPLAQSDGISRMTWRSGPAGRGAISIRAANASAAGEASLPTGVAAALSGESAATVQVRATGGSCFTLPLGTVTKSEASLFRAKP